MMGKDIRTFNLAFDEKQISVLVAGLHKLPGSLCTPLLGSIRNQIDQQMQLKRRKGENKKSIKS
jgi:hypothetical protein